MPVNIGVQNCLALIYFFSLPFLYWDPIGLRGSITIPAFLFLMYAIYSLINIKKIFSLKQFYLPLASLFIFWVLLITHEIFNTKYFTEELQINKTFLQIIFMFWLFVSHFSLDERLYRLANLSFQLSIILCVLLIFNGVGLQASDGEDYYGARLYFFGMNPNVLSNIAALSMLLGLFSIFEESRQKSNFEKVMVLIGLFSSLFVFSFTASRGGPIIAGACTLILFFLSRKSFLSKFISLILFIVFSYLVLYNLFDFSLLLNRFSDSSNMDSLGGRAPRWHAAFEIFSDNPIWGVGLSGYDSLTNIDFGFSGSAHNAFLEVLAQTGIVGFVFFITPSIYAFHLSMKSYFYSKKIAPFILLVFYLLIMVKGGGALNSAFNWLVLAMSIGVSHMQLNTKERA